MKHVSSLGEKKTLYETLRGIPFAEVPYRMRDPESDIITSQDRVNYAREAMAVWHVAKQ